VDSPVRPLLVFDGDCGFCRSWIARWQRVTGERVAYAPYQEVASSYPDIPRERFAHAVQLIEPDGRQSEAAKAVFRSLAYADRGAVPLWLYEHIPGFAPASEWAYRLVARNRKVFSKLTEWIWGRHVVPPGEALTSWIFLRALGVIFAIAFVSLWAQIIGLAGHDGILPAQEFLDRVRTHFGVVRYWYLPTVFWWNASDVALYVVCAMGTLLSLLLALGIAPVLCLAGAWAAYLSLATVGQDFLWFQWDGLLLEAGFIAMFLAPWCWRSRPGAGPPPRFALWMLRWLLFRLLFASAVVKLTSGDPTWRGLTALTYHYETQPLPPWTAWYVHHLPIAFHKLSALMMFACEGLAPFFILAPRRIRFAGAAAIVGLQAMILVTGNYGFFNLLTIALCALMLDDGAWPSRWRERSAHAPIVHGGPAWPKWVLRPVLTAMFTLSLVPVFAVFNVPMNLVRPLPDLYNLVSPFRTVNSYRLFAVMTTRRAEIIVEGSADGVEWKPYEFAYKPGDVMRMPRFMMPHMPRLDWQMWFAALSDYRRESWFLYFCQRLLEGKRPVEAMLAKNPFPAAPPRYIRAVLWEYHFTDAATRRATGAWWRRERLGLYCPVLALEGGKLIAVGEGEEPR
jgi:predicted DCC family thiol-disulfide oxidoreductase YuxK